MKHFRWDVSRTIWAFWVVAILAGCGEAPGGLAVELVWPVKTMPATSAPAEGEPTEGSLLRPAAVVEAVWLDLALDGPTSDFVRVAVAARGAVLVALTPGTYGLAVTARNAGLEPLLSAEAVARVRSGETTPVRLELLPVNTP